ncbi:MAG: hypothetical protein PHX08_11640 [Lachnospiraceae bacterium]|nr:hypothetical protein [Lachnospiraceae bacterium]
MAEKSKREKKNVYEMAGKVGKVIKKGGGLFLTVGGTFLLSKGPDLIKKMKK